jgi:hypothetical protein
MRVDPNNPLDFGKPQRDISAAEQAKQFALVNRLNKLRAIEYPEDEALTARIKSYELAFRMQTSVPKVMKFEEEKEHIKKLYGIDEPATRAFGMQLLDCARWQKAVKRRG